MPPNGEILDALRKVIDPDTRADIVSLGYIKNLQHDAQGRVSFFVELPNAAHPHKESIRTASEEAVQQLPGVSAVNVVMTSVPPPRKNPLRVQAPGLAKVKNIIAVSSCKGGVGKSTTSVNFAYSLAKMGFKVGLFDADVYGPSLSTLVTPTERELFVREELIQPLVYEGVKLMSFGFVSSEATGGGGPAIMRGPMVTQVINQLLTTTEWGKLDYLVIDMPPGTGDIQLTLTQLIPITAAIIVTTPQQLSFVDVVKGIQMFDKLKVPTVAVVENMSYFVCPGCNTKHYVFGQGARKKLMEQFGISNTYEIPLRDEISRLSDAGTPVVLADPKGPASQIYATITESVVEEVERIKQGGLTPPTVTFSAKKGILITLGNGEELVCAPPAVRRACRCAHCVEEFSNKPLLDPATIPETIYPRSITPMGNYAVAVTWSDGHASSIYPYELLLKLAQPVTA